jgi:hypothetical protein
MERRYLLKRGIAGIAAVTIAGCSDSTTPESNNDDSSPEDSPSNNDETTDGEDTSTDGTDEQTDSEESTEEEDGETEEGNDGDDLPTVQLNESTYDFTEGELYKYETELIDSSSVDTWEVTGVSGSEVTVKRTVTTDGETETITKSDSSENIYRTFDRENISQSLFPNLRDVQYYAGLDELTPGSEFIADTSNSSSIAWDSETVEVQEETSVNGISCIKFTATATFRGSSITKTACVAKGYPFALSLVFKQNESTLIDTTLSEMNRP